MNHIYKLIWSTTTNSWVACSELAKKGKSKSLKTILITAGISISSITFAAECTKGSQGEYNIQTSGTVCSISEAVKIDFGAQPIRYPAGIWLQAGHPQATRIVKMDIASVDINAIYNMSGSGNQLYFTNAVASEVVGIEASSSNETDKTVMTVNGDTNLVMDATGAKQVPSRSDPVANTTEAQVNFIGIAADTGAEINLNKTTIDLTVKYLRGSGFLGNQNYSYGLLAGSYLNIAESSSHTGKESIIKVDGDLNITMKLSTDSDTSNSGQLLSGIRAIQGGYESGTNAYQGSSGVVLVNGNLDLNITGANVEGIYVSGEGTRVELNGSQNKIKTTGTSTSTVNAIKLGKARTSGTGSGTLIVRGDLDIDHSNNSATSAAVALLNKESVFNAQYNTNNIKIRTTGDVFSVGGSDWGTESPSDSTKILLSNADLATSALNRDIFRISSGQKAVLIDVNGSNTNIIAAKNGYILNSNGTTNAPSVTTMNFADGYMKGLVKKATNDTVTLNLEKARWQLEKSDQVNTALFTDLNLNNASELIAYNSQTELSNFTLSGEVNSKNSSLNLSNDLLGDTLTINGNYKGEKGRIILDTELDDDSSQTDKFIISGNATGSTELQVNKVGGAGAQTINGIHVIQTGSSESNQTFYLNGGAVSAGAYDYLLNLKKANTGTNTTAFDNWYLESKLKQDGGEPEIPVYTPDVGEYLAAETMGNTLFTMRLEDREGASQYQNLGNKDTGNVWVRAYGGHNQFKSMQDQLKTKGNSFVTQIGTGLVTLGEEDQYNLGVMGGFATYSGKTRSNLTNRESKTKINGYSLGLYGTWYAHPVEERGAYIDSWVLWNKFNNKIDTPDQNKYKYDSSGITASIEVGGDYLLNKNGKKDWWIQPQAQLIYQGVHAEDFKDAQDVDINHGRDNLQARMGVKTYLNIPTNGNKLTNYRPYVALNFIHNTNPYSVVIDDVRYENEGSANLGEFKLGVEGQVTQNSHVWLNASYVAGSHNNQTYQGNIGWKYNF